MIITIYCIMTIIVFVWLGLVAIAVKTDDDDGFCEFVRDRLGENAVDIGLIVIVTILSLLWPLSLMILLVMHLYRR